MSLHNMGVQQNLLVYDVPLADSVNTNLNYVNPGHGLHQSWDLGDDV